MLLSVDLVPHGLRKAIGPKIVTVSGRDLLKHMAAQFEDAVEHAAREAKRAAEGDKGQLGVKGQPGAGQPGAGQPADPPPAG